MHGRILEKLGVTRVVFPEREMAERTARSLVIPNALDYITLSTDFSIVEVTVPPSFVGQTLRSIELRARYGLTLVAIKRQVDGKEETLVSPPADEVLLAGRHRRAARQQRDAGADRDDSLSGAARPGSTGPTPLSPTQVAGADESGAEQCQERRLRHGAPACRRSRHPRRWRCPRRTGLARWACDALVADEEVREGE